MRATRDQGAIRLEVNSEAVEIAWNCHGLVTRVLLGGESTGRVAASEPTAPDRAIRLAESLREYFRSGSPITQLSWDDIDTTEWTEFQRKVYTATTAIPHGETRTYGWIARRIGAPAATRAVGQALGRNPVPLLVPCHRVISGKPSKGSAEQPIGGFMGEDRPDSPELRLKMKLLELEDRFVNPRFFS